MAKRAISHDKSRARKSREDPDRGTVACNMKSIRSAVLVSLLATVSIASVGCSKPTDDEQKKSETALTAALTSSMASASAAPTTAPTAAAPTTAAVTVSPEMTAFMGMLDGGDKSASAALKKYAVPTMQNDDLGMYKLTSPKVTSSETSGALQCYSMTSTAGVMTHVTKVCWNAKGKIASIADTSS
jgi:hypothetical protein